jgi:hypothetical protein
MPVCDVCSRSMDFSQGYALSTTEVATNPKYWEFMLNNHSFPDDNLLLMYVQQQAVQVTGWLVCESCSGMFTFDRATRRGYAQRQQNPPGSGPADVNYVAAAAAKAWKGKHGVFPSWVR